MAGARLLPGMFKSNTQKLRLGMWPWTEGLKSRVPLHFKKSYIEKFMKEPVPVHFRPDPRKWIVDDYGNRSLVVNAPILLKHVPEQDMGLWGGESFICGYRKKKNKAKKPSMPYVWRPAMMKRSLYSEILDRWMQITVTRRTLDLIDENFGFDFYILKTHEVDLQSKLGMRLKREMLLTLCNKSMYRDNPEKQEEIYKKYAEFIRSADEVEWLGLTISQAEKKQARIEAEEQANPKPLKEVYMAELVQQLQNNELDDDAYGESQKKSMLSSINPFK